MDASLLDTDTLSEVLKARNSATIDAARRYLAEHQRFAFSAITLHEIVRGMLAKRASRQLANFLNLAASSDVLPVEVPVLMRAADLWAVARDAGHPCADADLIIAATALEAGRVLVTGNFAHFSWINGLRLDDWRATAP